MTSRMWKLRYIANKVTNGFYPLYHTLLPYPYIAANLQFIVQSNVVAHHLPSFSVTLYRLEMLILILTHTEHCWLARCHSQSKNVSSVILFF